MDASSVTFTDAPVSVPTSTWPGSATSRLKLNASKEMPENFTVTSACAVAAADPRADANSTGDSAEAMDDRDGSEAMGRVWVPASTVERCETGATRARHHP